MCKARLPLCVLMQMIVSADLRGSGQAMGEFTDKVVLVTGATAGIGKVTAVEFAKAGAKVAITGRRKELGAQTVREIEVAGGEGLFIACDGTKAEDVKHAIDTIDQAWGRLDIAFNNAGIGARYVPVADQSEEEYDAVMAINVKGVWLSMKCEIPLMLRSGGGSIINNASVGGLIGLAGMAIYNGSKHAVLGMTKSAAIDYCKQGIRVNAVCPGIIITEMAMEMMGGREGVNEAGGSRQPMGRAGESEEIASTVMWLASDASSFVTGQSIAVDGGRTATG
jgi:NAD(P)-dependent dehydrogenase (short-subunit alcohol dehydrogenase family)